MTLIDEKAKSVKDLKVWIKTAVLGNITPNLRGITGYREDGCLYIFYYFRDSYSEDDMETVSVITTELLANTDDDSFLETWSLANDSWPLLKDYLLYECNANSEV